MGGCRTWKVPIVAVERLVVRTAAKLWVAPFKKVLVGALPTQQRPQLNLVGVHGTRGRGKGERGRKRLCLIRLRWVIVGKRSFDQKKT